MVSGEIKRETGPALWNCERCLSRVSVETTHNIFVAVTAKHGDAFATKLQDEDGSIDRTSMAKICER